ncbi:hypothetical protein HAX54_024838 [Datura stramonium]|uniref:Uncharacterized protein n=1 Tax=Datura stramonium TaxID=4076 RepID=A0ABS8UZP2_DATST|nr:hypothetical protein [Datura stramonium]
MDRGRPRKIFNNQARDAKFTKNSRKERIQQNPEMPLPVGGGLGMGIPISLGITKDVQQLSPINVLRVGRLWPRSALCPPTLKDGIKLVELDQDELEKDVKVDVIGTSNGFNPLADNTLQHMIQEAFARLRQSEIAPGWEWHHIYDAGKGSMGALESDHSEVLRSENKWNGTHVQAAETRDFQNLLNNTGLVELKATESDRTTIPFKFLNHLAEHQDFATTVSQVWDVPVEIACGEGLKEIEIDERCMGKLHRREFPKVDAKIQDIRHKLAELQTQLRDTYDNQELYESEKALKLDL